MRRSVSMPLAEQLAALEGNIDLHNDVPTIEVRDQLFRIFADLCDSFVHAAELDRDQIRKVFTRDQRRSDRIRLFAIHNAMGIKSLPDASSLSRGLVAMSIENCAVDFRDTLMALAELWVRAEQAGIDPQPFFSTAAEFSTNEKTPGGCESVATMLRDFGGYAVVKERRRAPYWPADNVTND